MHNGTCHFRCSSRIPIATWKMPFSNKDNLLDLDSFACLAPRAQNGVLLWAVTFALRREHNAINAYQDCFHGGLTLRTGNLGSTELLRHSAD